MASTATFEYSVRDRSGQMVKGKLTGESQAAVVAKLRAQGYAPVSVKKSGSGLQKELSIPGLSKRVTLKDLAVMSRQFATMINSGLSLLRALDILSSQTENQELARVLGLVRADIESGISLSSALAKHPNAFPPLFVSMCRAGEVGGFLDSVLLQIAENYEAEVKLRGKIKSAMTYPVVVFVIAILAVVGMLLFVVPVFANMFSDLGGELPAPTKALVFLSSALKVVAPALVLAGIVSLFTWPKVKHKPQVRNVLDPIKLKLPIFGKLSQKIALSRFTRNLGTMMRSGVPILQSLEIVGSTAGNVVLQRAVTDVSEAVRRGESLARPLERHSVFPPMVVQMLVVGEDTGALDTMLHKISDFYDQEVEATAESLTSLIEPLMIAVLGGVIGSMIIALYMPIFGVFDLIK
ncbi:type II secretion system F family protein [Motilibacter aurantiacus]|uniref:type II secretion system F family protein n=1 Tax=Motilibacter aurantiacus TaxID=2714955 RepID=UPI00140CBECF|nr:type II secretion system F family protein [Motilibacter aurantiacus]NHC46038.1 type II secretion system F family protein [Motilibacter aurantiacus]